MPSVSLGRRCCSPCCSPCCCLPPSTLGTTALSQQRTAFRAFQAEGPTQPPRGPAAEQYEVWPGAVREPGSGDLVVMAAPPKTSREDRCRCCCCCCRASKTAEAPEMVHAADAARPTEPPAPHGWQHHFHHQVHHHHHHRRRREHLRGHRQKSILKRTHHRSAEGPGQERSPGQRSPGQRPLLPTIPAAHAAPAACHQPLQPHHHHHPLPMTPAQAPRRNHLHHRHRENRHRQQQQQQENNNYLRTDVTHP